MFRETETRSKPPYLPSASNRRPGAEYRLADAFHDQPDQADSADTTLLAELTYLYWLASERQPVGGP
ncbi:hypothetical protein BJL95_17025 [Methylomonas sp. LWB]|nr:hypothetical protein BJL95_17025 [Methylomonas sp. LWB]